MFMQHVQTFCPRSKHLALLCLGADIALLSVLSDPNSNTGGKQKNERLRVTAWHSPCSSEFQVLLIGANHPFDGHIPSLRDTQRLQNAHAR